MAEDPTATGSLNLFTKIGDELTAVGHITVHSYLVDPVKAARQVANALDAYDRAHESNAAERSATVKKAVPSETGSEETI